MMHKRFFLVVGLLMVALPVAAATTATFTHDLRLGDRGSEVLQLQKLLNTDPDTRVTASGGGSPGMETDYFGSLTRAAVMRFQNKYRSEVLYPAAVFEPTGFVGSLTRAKLNRLSDVAVSPTVPTVAVPKLGVPSVESVTPAEVRPGDTFTITGKNFTPTGNTVVLRFGLLETSIANLPSPDGKTISVTYQPAKIAPIEEQMAALPPDTAEGIRSTLTSHYLTVSDLENPYKKFRNEDELNAALKPFGYSVRNLEDPYVVSVQNTNGVSQELTVKINGMRKLVFGSSVSDAFQPLLSHLKEVISSFVPVAHAQLPSGGFHAAIVWWCTCSGGYMSFIVGAGSTPSGLYYFAPWTIPLDATSMMPGAFWLGFTTPGASTCLWWVPNFPPFCLLFPGNLMNAYGGSF